MSQFRDPPPIEELSELSWRRLEESTLENTGAPVVQSSTPPRRWNRFAIVGGLAACAAALAFFVLGSNQDIPQVPPPFSRLVTTASPSTMSLPNSTIEAGPNTAVSVTEDKNGGVRVLLERGSVHCDVDPQGQRASFVVVAGDVTVEVTGTVFAVTRVQESAEVTVTRGSVQVFAGGRLSKVAAGQRWPAVTAVAPVSPPTDERRDETATSRNERKPGAAKRPDAAQTNKTNKPERPSSKERYSQAAALEASSSAKAISIYRSLARGRGPWAANSLYALARLEVERGNLARGRRALTRYIKRFPKGANVADARALLANIKRKQP